jgi:hypothetical protein
MRNRWSSVALSAVLLGVPAAASAQVNAESPMFVPPRAESGLGIFILDASGGGLGGVGIWRSPSYNWGLRLGLAEDSGDDIAVFGGIDFLGGLHRETRDLPFDIDWLIGAFLSVGDDARISAPLGLTFGHTFPAQGASFTPFFTPRIVLDIDFFEDPVTEDTESDADLDFAADLGLDLRLRGFQPVIRFAASLGRDAIGVGFVFNPSQRTAAR